jgi:hypothetical protein
MHYIKKFQIQSVGRVTAGCKQSSASSLLRAGSLLDLLFGPEDGGDMFLALLTFTRVHGNLS